MVGGDDLAQILGIEARRQRRRADQIAEHYGQLPALGIGGSRRIRGAAPSLRRWAPWRERGDGIQQLAPVGEGICHPTVRNLREL